MSVREKIILKGWHYPINPFIRLLRNKASVAGKAMFHDPYYPMIITDDYDFNKLVGISFDLRNKRSIRIAWRPSKTDSTEVVLYTYVHNGDGKRPTPEYITKVKKKEWFEYSIQVLPFGKAQFTVNSDVKIIDFDAPTKYWGYLQSPYFGGDKTAPHTMCISMSSPEVREPYLKIGGEVKVKGEVVVFQPDILREMRASGTPSWFADVQSLRWKNLTKLLASKP